MLIYALLAPGTGHEFVTKAPYVARIFVVHSTETWINSVVFIWNFCVLYYWSCFFGQRYMVSGVETHRLHLLSSTDWLQVHENVSYWKICFQPCGEWIDWADLQDLSWHFWTQLQVVKASTWLLPTEKIIEGFYFLRKFLRKRIFAWWNMPLKRPKSKAAQRPRHLEPLSSQD